MKRLLSLDVFRGLTVAAMILVNNPGDWSYVYAPLEHAVWNGCTPTDLVFPFFLFIVGVSIAYALAEATPAALPKILTRSLKLFGLGLFLNVFPSFNLETVRIPGVLQRIALVYLVCASLFVTTGPTTQRGLLGIFLLGYWALLTLVPVPGVGTPNLEPEANFAAWFDRLVLGEKHLWKAVDGVWDPEGLLSTVPAFATGLLGVEAGRLLRYPHGNASRKTQRLAIFGLALLVLGWLWSGVFPINKSLWTSSYAVYTAGWAALVLAGLFWVIDGRGWRRWTKPFVVYGVNAITVFFLSGLIPRMLNLIKVPLDGQPVGLQTFLYRSAIAPWFPDPYLASLAGALTFVLLWLGILAWMYDRKVIVKV